MEIKVTQSSNGPSFEGLSLNEVSASELLEALEWVWHNAMSAERGEIQASVEAAIAKARGKA